MTALFLFLKLYCHFFKVVMGHRAHEQSRCAGQRTTCNLQQFMFQVQISSPFVTTHACTKKRTDALRCEMALEKYSEVNVHSSFLKEKEVTGQNSMH